MKFFYAAPPERKPPQGCAPAGSSATPTDMMCPLSTVVFNITNFDVGYHDANYVKKNASAIFKPEFFMMGGVRVPWKMLLFVQTNNNYYQDNFS
jgi:hypothetical protein